MLIDVRDLFGGIFWMTYPECLKYIPINRTKKREVIIKHPKKYQTSQKTKKNKPGQFNVFSNL